MVVHETKGIIPTAPGLDSWTNNQVVVSEFEFDGVPELTLFQKCFRDTDATRVSIQMRGIFIFPIRMRAVFVPLEGCGA